MLLIFFCIFIFFAQNYLHGLGLALDFLVSMVFGRLFVKWFAQCYRTIVYLSVLSVTLVYCGQTVGWIRMKLGMVVGLGLATLC